MKNSAGREGCYPPRPKAEVDNVHIDRYVGRDVDRHIDRGVRKLHMIPEFFISYESRIQ